MSRSDELQRGVDAALERLSREFADLGDALPMAMARAAIHRGIHAALDSGKVEYCAMATYLAEMIGHAHQVAHGKGHAPHADVQH